MTKPQKKLIFGFVAGLVLTYLSLAVFDCVNSDKGIGEFSVFTLLAVFFSYELMLLNLLKGDYLTQKHTKNIDKALSIIVKLFLGLCIIMLPLMWGLSITLATV